MSYKKLGEYIEQVERRNDDLKFGVEAVRGVSNNKQFIPTRANNIGRDIQRFYVISPGEFVYNSRTTRMGDKVGLGYNDTDETFLTSWNNSAFKVKDEARHLLNPTYLFIFFNRQEFDRYARFHSWGSSTELFSWDEMCEIEIYIPDIDTQNKFVAVYEGLIANQKTYESSLADLQLICDTYIEDLIKKEPLKRLGIYIERTDERNTDNSLTNVMGMSTQKKFREPNSRVNKKQLSNYRIVNKGEFAYVQTTDTWRCLAVALSDYEYPIVVSPVYVTFKVKSTNDLLPEFLFLYMKREEFDRYARFHSWGSARENFTWDDMCNIEMPIPSIEKQKAIVTIYHTLETRKRINEQLKESIKPLCPVLMKGVVEGMETIPKHITYEI